jgi:hypothetical protein
MAVKQHNGQRYFRRKGTENMQKPIQISHKRRDEYTVNAPRGGLPVHTNLRAGLAWDDLDDKAKELWNSLTGAVSNTVSSVTGSTPSTTAN